MSFVLNDFCHRHQQCLCYCSQWHLSGAFTAEPQGTMGERTEFWNEVPVAQGIYKPSSQLLLCSITQCGGLCIRDILKYRKASNIRRTKCQNLNDSRLFLQLSVPNPLKPSVKSIMKMYLEQRREAMLQLHLSYRQFYCQLRCVLY